MAGFLPDRFFSRVTRISVERDIVAAGYKAVFLDLDNTLLPRDTHQVPDDIRAWIEELKASGLAVCLLSNNWHHGAHEWAERLGLPIVSHAVKPLPFAYWIARHRTGVRAWESLAIGDQLITDVWGGHFSGMRVFMVLPLVSVDLKHTLILRKVEKLFTRNLTPER